MQLKLSPKKERVFLQTVIWKTITDFFSQKKIDVSKELVSISIRERKIVVKVKSSILKQELRLMHPNLAETYKEHFSSLGKDPDAYEFIYT